MLLENLYSNFKGATHIKFSNIIGWLINST